jgi:Ca-activated chloride channel homolog
MNLEVLVLIDASGSMEDKMLTVQESLLDLSISLNSRIGENEFSIFAFPGKKKEVEELLSWSSKLDSIGKIFSKISLGGITPTGPAIKEGIAAFTRKRSSKRSFLSDDAPGYIEESGM